MSDIAIRIDNLSKRYRIGSAEAKHETLVGGIFSWLRSPVDNLRDLRRLSRFDDSDAAEDVIWALKDVSCEVKTGEVVGVIGRNGAGKSTLLKILSQITEPTRGRVEIFGRVSSLLEVGTGFHMELTGRENVFLNGSILGMSKSEIERKFDEIVSFAEIGKFIDTPVKRYSSGMRVRLAFAVAAHLEPDVLIVDEVLSVGDIAFQQKCVGKMNEVAMQGRTVLFVSHNLAAITQLCETGLVLEKGRVVKRGPIANAAEYYAQYMTSDAVDETHRSEEVYVEAFHIGDTDGPVDTTRPIRVHFNFVSTASFWRVRVLFVIRNADQALVIRQELDSQSHPRLASPGRLHVELDVPPIWLRTGQYSSHVKVIADSLGSQQRFVTDPQFFLAKGHVNGKEQLGNELLTPRCSWEIATS